MNLNEPLPKISMCWDGATPTAELTVEGITLVAAPGATQEMFDVLCGLRDRAETAERRLGRIQDELRRLAR